MKVLCDPRVCARVAGGCHFLALPPPLLLHTQTSLRLRVQRRLGGCTKPYGRATESTPILSQRAC